MRTVCNTREGNESRPLFLPILGIKEAKKGLSRQSDRLINLTITESPRRVVHHLLLSETLFLTPSCDLVVFGADSDL